MTRAQFTTEFPGALRRGLADSSGVVHLQQWLCLHNHHVAIDGDFGQATEIAVKSFQVGRGRPGTGLVDFATWRMLVKPLIDATAIRPALDGATIPELIVSCARQHLAQRPREVGGQNMGPWVRHYMRGREGRDWAWCAGFACTVVYQAFARLGQPVQHFGYTQSCDELIAIARLQGTLISTPQPGALFVRRSKTHANDWDHTGIVIDAPGTGIMHTIDGNSNTNGSRDGIEVCQLTRGVAGYDFILIQ